MSEGSGSIVIDLAALGANVAEVRRRAPGFEIIASVKGNAYGHGVVRVSKVLADEGVYALGTGSVEDAIAIRDSGNECKIVMFGRASADDVRIMEEYRLTPTVDSLKVGGLFGQSSAAGVNVFVKIDAGLGRFGVPLECAEAFVDSLGRLPRISVEGLYTHLPFADETGRTRAIRASAAFMRIVDRVRLRTPQVPIVQCAASAALLFPPDDGLYGNAVSPGHVLYGIPVMAGASPKPGAGFKPTLRGVESRLVQVSRHCRRAGFGKAGYGSRSGAQVIGVVPVGTAHGYPSAKRGSHAYMLVSGARCRVLSVSMEFTTLDLTGVDADVGRRVVVIGDETSPCGVAELSRATGKSVLEILCAVSGRLPYTYVR